VARAGDEITVRGGNLPADPSGPCMHGQDQAFHVHEDMR
jgi:hypothetical protein